MLSDTEVLDSFEEFCITGVATVKCVKYTVFLLNAFY